MRRSVRQLKRSREPVFSTKYDAYFERECLSGQRPREVHRQLSGRRAFFLRQPSQLASEPHLARFPATRSTAFAHSDNGRATRRPTFARRERCPVSTADGGVRRIRTHLYLDSEAALYAMQRSRHSAIPSPPLSAIVAARF